MSLTSKNLVFVEGYGFGLIEEANSEFSIVRTLVKKRRLKVMSGYYCIPENLVSRSVFDSRSPISISSKVKLRLTDSVIPINE